MVAITMKNMLLLAAALTSAVPFVTAQRYYDSGSLAVRGYYDDDLDARDFYEEPVSVREYIDEQIEFALREYDDAFQELLARHSQSTIDAEIKKFEKAYKEAKAKLKPAQKKVKDAQKAYDKDKSESNKTALRRAKSDLDSIQGAMGAAEESLEYWKKEKASPSPAGSPKGSPKGKKK